MMRDLFVLRGELTGRTRLAVQFAGWAVFLAAWQAFSAAHIVPHGILPSPFALVAAFGPLLRHGLAYHTVVSIELNFLGYLEATAIALPLGFALALSPMLSALSERPLASIRGTPLPAALGMFIALLGIGTAMKVNFLAAGIAVYLLPAVVQRVKTTEPVYDWTVRTLGASTWQRIRYVYLPDGLARSFDDIRVLAPLSWTYVTVAEAFGSKGLGALAWNESRNSNNAGVWAILFEIVVIIAVQDLCFLLADRFFFPHKQP